MYHGGRCSGRLVEHARTDSVLLLLVSWPAALLGQVFYENIPRTSAVSSTNFEGQYSSLQAALLVLVIGITRRDFSSDKKVL